MEDIKYLDERECLGIDCAWCLKKECSLWIKEKNEEKQDD
jgi:hypothetical protein